MITQPTRWLLAKSWCQGNNLTSEGGLIKFSLSLTRQGLFAYVHSNPPQCYWSPNAIGLLHF